MNRKFLALLLALLPAAAFGQASGVGQIWSAPTATLQNAAVANGSGAAMGVSGLSAVMVTVNCSVACSGGTTITFELSQDGTHYAPVNGEQVGTTTVSQTVVNQGTTPTLWRISVGGAASLEAVISGYSAGTVTVTAQGATGTESHGAIASANIADVGGAAPSAANPLPVEQSDGTNVLGTATHPVQVSLANTALNATPVAENTAQVGGNNVATAATGVQKVGVTGNTGAAVDGANNAAIPPNALAEGCEYSSALPSISSGDLYVKQCDSSGRELVNVAALPAITAAPSAAAANAATPYEVDALTAAATVKSSAGNVYGWYVYNPNSTVCYLEVFNTTTPTLGTTAPVLSLGIPASSGANIGPSPLAVANFTTAIEVAATTASKGSTTCTTGMTVNIWYN